MEVTEDLRAKQVRMAVTRRIKELGRAGKVRQRLNHHVNNLEGEHCCTMRMLDATVRK